MRQGSPNRLSSACIFSARSFGKSLRKRTHTRLVKAGLDAKPQFPLKVWDEDGTIVGEYFADILFEGELIVEIKAAKSLGVEHEAQPLGYLRAAKIDHGLLINFGAPKFQIRKFALSEPPKSSLMA